MVLLLHFDYACPACLQVTCRLVSFGEANEGPVLVGRRQYRTWVLIDSRHRHRFSSSSHFRYLCVCLCVFRHCFPNHKRYRKSTHPFSACKWVWIRRLGRRWCPSILIRCWSTSRWVHWWARIARAVSSRNSSSSSRATRLPTDSSAAIEQNTVSVCVSTLPSPPSAGEWEN